MPDRAGEWGPLITRLEPATGRAGVGYPIQVTIHGRGFSEGENLVSFGGIEVGTIPSSDEGTRITFWVPKEEPSRGEVPPMELLPGEYPVTVTTGRGTSGPAIFTLTMGR